MRTVKTAILMLLGFVAGAAALPGVTQTFPGKPARIIVPYTPGGAVDSIARILATQVSARFGQPVVVDNRPGAGGDIGVAATAKSAPDGYTVVFASTGPVAVSAHFRQLAYNPIKDLAPIALLTITPLVIVVNDALPIKNFTDLVAYVQSRPDGVNYSVSGIGNQIHLAGELFKSKTGLKLTAVPYKGTQPAAAAIASGEVAMGISDIGSVKQLPRVRIIAVLDSKRSSMAPEVPTVGEYGLSGFSVNGWIALLAPAGTPTNIIQRWNADVNYALALPEVRKLLLNNGLEPTTSTPEQARQFVSDEFDKWGEVIRTANIKIE